MVKNILETLINRYKNNNFLDCSSSPPFNSYVCSTIYKYGSGIRFETNGSEPGEYVQIHIKNFFIIPNQYRIKSFEMQSGHTHLKSWVLSGSNDNQNWLQIHFKENEDQLNHKYAEKYYPIEDENALHTPFSYFRLTVIQSWSSRTPFRLSLSEIDFSGRIIHGSYYSCGSFQIHISFLKAMCVIFLIK